MNSKNIPKCIKKLAAKLYAKELKNEKQFPTSLEVFEEMLLGWRWALLSGNYWTRVDSVSKSGMSRVIEIAYIRKNQLQKAYHPLLLELAGCDKNGRISGCGMDMLFAAQYDLFRSLCPGHRYQTAMKQYNCL